MIIGAQAYTIRDFCKDEQSIKDSFKKLKEIGFNSYQHSGIAPVPAEFIKEVCDEVGLQIVVTHSNPTRIIEDTDNLIKEHKIMGCNHIGIGIMPKEYRWSIEGMNAFIKDYSYAVDKIADAGMKFHYHNHGSEFQKFGSQTMLEIMAESTDPAKWGFIFDTYWSQVGGCCPAQTMYKLAGRIDICHLKDLSYTYTPEVEGDFTQRFAPVGSGSIAWDEVFEACEKTGIKYAEIEQDNCYGEDPFEQLKISYEFLKSRNCEF